MKIAGIDNKKAILIESSLLKPTNNADVITTPALDTPGIIASVCINPMKIITAYEQLRISLLSFLFLSYYS